MDNNWYRFYRPYWFFWQRITRGFNDSETWNLDYTIAKLVLPRLKRFKELTNGIPGDFSIKDRPYIKFPENITDDEKTKIRDKVVFKEWNETFS